ncbi:MAG: 3-deoxy-manno-octulosonate cytidylyltransferase [Thermodesulfovibrionia bacterium]|nr:3-deoxy-manno-octulosonate cytidylyltransferase [Thermodesulfovibrionia bacterium]
MLRAVAIIPARFASTRLPGKPLASLKGKVLIQRVYEQASSAKLIDAVFVATDDKRIFDVVNNFGGKAVMTSSSHISGTDRIAEAAKNIDCEIIVNVQGDEPFIRPEMVDDTVKLLIDDPRAAISTLAKKTTNIEEILSPDVVKVVMDNEGFAMYFSRSPIPYYRDEWQVQNTEHRTQSTENPPSPPFSKGGMEGFVFKLRTPNSELPTFFCFKHIGIYGFRKEVLIDFSILEQGRLEMIEKLEQLRALASGMKIKVKETVYDTFGIDTIEDLRKAEEWLSLSS